MRIQSLTVNHKSRVSVRWEGGLTSYNTSQYYAIKYIAEDGTTPDCYVETENYRIAGQPLPDAHCKARRFAARAGVAYRDKVTFPIGATWDEAYRLADATGEPFQAINIRYVGSQFCNDGTFSEWAWQVRL